MRRNRGLRALLCSAMLLRGARGASDSTAQYVGFDGFIASIFLVSGAALLFVVALVVLAVLYICGRRTQSAALVMLGTVERGARRKNNALQAEHALAIEEMLSMQTGLLAQMEEMQSRLDAVESGGSPAPALRSSDDISAEARTSRRVSGDLQPPGRLPRTQATAASSVAPPAAAATVEHPAASGAATPEPAAATPAAQVE